MKGAKWAIAGLSISMLCACAALDVGPINDQNAGATISSPQYVTDPGDDGSMSIALAFSGGGMRAAAFSYGVLRALDDITVDMEPYQRSMIDNVRVVSGVSGGAVTATYFGYRGRDEYRDFHERFLYKNAEASMLTSPLVPITLTRALSGGVNDRSSFAGWLDRNVFQGATFSAFNRPNTPSIWIHASDIYNRTPFMFDGDTLSALCSDLNRVKLADAVAASSAVPVVFTPVLLEADHPQCNYSPPAWLIKAAAENDAPVRLKAYAKALSTYHEDADQRFVRLMDGGLTDNLGITGFTLERASAQTPHGPLSPEAAVRLRHFIFIVVDAGQGQTSNWANSRQGPWLAPLLEAVIDTSMTASSRHGFDALKLAMQEWRTEIIKYRCSLSTSQVKRMRGSLSGWNCRDVNFTVERVSFSDLEPGMAARMNKVETRLTLPKEQVESVIEAGRTVVTQRSTIMKAARDVQQSANVSNDLAVTTH